MPGKINRASKAFIARKGDASKALKEISRNLNAAFNSIEGVTGSRTLGSVDAASGPKPDEGYQPVDPVEPAAYSMPKPSYDPALSKVGHGTPMGEDLVLFRDGEVIDTDASNLGSGGNPVG